MVPAHSTIEGWAHHLSYASSPLTDLPPSSAHLGKQPAPSLGN